MTDARQTPTNGPDSHEGVPRHLFVHEFSADGSCDFEWNDDHGRSRCQSLLSQHIALGWATPEATVTEHPFSIHSRRSVCRLCHLPADRHATTEATSAFAAPGVPVAWWGSVERSVISLTLEEVEADAAIDAQATVAHVGSGQPEVHADFVDHARVIAVLNHIGSPDVTALDAQTGGHVYVVEADLGTEYSVLAGEAVNIVAQCSIQDGHWLFGVEGRTPTREVFGFNIEPLPGQAPPRDTPALSIASDLLAIAQAIGDGDPDGSGLPVWASAAHDYVGGYGSVTAIKETPVNDPNGYSAICHSPGFAGDHGRQAKPKPAKPIATVDVTPEWESTLRWFAEAVATHSFTFGSYGPVASLLEQARYLAAKDPEALQRVIDGLVRKG